MKPIMWFALWIGLLMPVYGQQQWYFSKNCPETPATSFTLDRSNRQLDNIFRASAALPAYEPVAPLTFSLSTRQFFLYPTPVVYGLEPPNASGSVQALAAGSVGTARTHAVSGVNNLTAVDPGFSTATGGISFTGVTQVLKRLPPKSD
jgi:hypothetical protein